MNENTKNLLASMVIPCFNVNEYLPCLLKSLEKILCEEIEIILIDDGSMDGTDVLIRNWKVDRASDNINCFFFDENKGQSTARNIGIEKSRGEYIWFIDSDDILDPYIANIIIESLKKYHPDVLFTDMQAFYDTKDYCNIKDIEQVDFRKYEPRSLVQTHFCEMNQNEILWYYFKDAMMYPCTAVFKKICIQDIRFPVGRKLEDVVTMPKIIANSYSYYYLSEVVVYYRLRNGSTMNTPKLQTFIDYSNAMADVVIYFENQSIDEESKIQMFLYYIKTLRWSLNDMIKHDLLTKESWLEYEKSLNVFYMKLQVSPLRFFFKSIGQDSMKNLFVAFIFIRFPKLYAVLKNKSLINRQSREK